MCQTHPPHTHAHTGKVDEGGRRRGNASGGTCFIFQQLRQVVREEGPVALPHRVKQSQYGIGALVGVVGAQSLTRQAVRGRLVRHTSGPPAITKGFRRACPPICPRWCPCRRMTAETLSSPLHTAKKVGRVPVPPSPSPGSPVSDQSAVCDAPFPPLPPAALAFGLLRAVMISKETSARALQVTADAIEQNAANYSAW